MCALYINTLNEAFGKQLIALDDDAICALTEYDYPGNHAQLKRILKQAVIKTNSLYLSNSVIQDILVQERQLYQQILIVNLLVMMNMVGSRTSVFNFEGDVMQNVLIFQRKMSQIYGKL